MKSTKKLLAELKKRNAWREKRVNSLLLSPLPR